MAGRDTLEINFFKKNGLEYVTAGGNLYASEELVKPLYTGKEFISSTTIQADGYANWFSVPEAAKGKVMTVKMPTKGSFAVYDQAGVCINYTVVSGNNEVLLPENGRIVFAGEAGSKFEISLKKINIGLSIRLSYKVIATLRHTILFGHKGDAKCVSVRTRLMLE